MNKTILDRDLTEAIDKYIADTKNKILVIGSGITSSHLGDERNLREYVLASEIVKYIQDKGKNVNFYLADDSFDPLLLNRLRIGVEKNDDLVEKFKKYLGIPIKLIPDPYSCHNNYSDHFQEKILDRFHKLSIYPTLFDIYDAYESGLYNKAKEIFLSNYEEVQRKLKKKFPKYSMKKIFWILCEKCNRLNDTDITSINNHSVVYKCNSCNYKGSYALLKTKGKFSWKIDHAIKWNLLKIDFEPFYKAYLDPDVGSYYIAKYISETFLDCHFPLIIEYGQLLMGKDFSSKLLASMPSGLLRTLLLENRKSDLIINRDKIISVTKNYEVKKGISYFDYVKKLLPNEILLDYKRPIEDQELKSQGVVFSKFILGINLVPMLPNFHDYLKIGKNTFGKINALLNQTLTIKEKNPNIDYHKFKELLENFLLKNEIKKSVIFPKLRLLINQPEGIPIIKTLYYLPGQFIFGFLSVLKRTN